MNFKGYRVNLNPDAQICMEVSCAAVVKRFWRSVDVAVKTLPIQGGVQNFCVSTYQFHLPCMTTAQG